MSLEIVSLQEEHLEEAAALVTTGYRALRRHVPLVPPRFEQAESILQLLHGLSGQAPGVAAVQGGRLTGFLLGWLLPDFRGKRSTYSPEWAHAAELDDRQRIYREMYAQLSAQWVAAGYVAHMVTFLAHDRTAVEAWHWLGFGLAAVDAMRDLAPVPGAAADVAIRRTGSQDVAVAMAFDEALRQHLAAAPIFLPEENHPQEYHERWLADPANVLWLAYQGDEAVGCMGLGPANPEACYLINDERTASILTAYTKEELRNGGIGSALLNHSLTWARTAGYERCAVDFESPNIPGASFWLRHFQPVCYSLIRHVDRGTGQSRHDD
jgi:GNAT superfamily N-acetyltransferase